MKTSLSWIHWYRSPVVCILDFKNINVCLQNSHYWRDKQTAYELFISMFTDNSFHDYFFVITYYYYGIPNKIRTVWYKIVFWLTLAQKLIIIYEFTFVVCLISSTLFSKACFSLNTLQDLMQMDRTHPLGALYQLD